VDCRGYIIITGEGIEDGYWFIRLFPDINDMSKYVQLKAIYTDPDEAEAEADMIMAFVYGEDLSDYMGE
jgi:hypothetical protein